MARARRVLHGLAHCAAVRLLAVLLAVAVAGLSVEHLPPLSLTPLLCGLVPWCVGTYVLCPLRWHGISASRRSRAWHLRVYAESELLGLLTPAHSGADVWRARQLRTAGQETRAAYAEVGLDRLLAGAGLLLFVTVSGGGLPRDVALPLGTALVLTGAVACVVRARRSRRTTRTLPPARALARGVGLSVCYQVAMFGLVLGGVAATGQSVGVLELMGAFGASQAASLVPGVHGCSAREGAMVAGLVSSGCSIGEAVGVVAAVTVAAWVPALLLGGGSLVLRRLQRRAPVTDVLTRPTTTGQAPAPVTVGPAPSLPRPRDSAEQIAPLALAA